VTFSKTIKITMAGMTLMAFAAAQDPAAAPAKKFKDDKEQTEAIAANNEKDPKAKLEKLDLWKHDYPVSEYDVDREEVYFVAYGALKMYHEEVMCANGLYKMNLPESLRLQVLRQIFTDVAQIKPAPGPDDLAALSDAAHYVIDHADNIFAPANAPAGTTADQWTQVKPALVEYAQKQLDGLAEQKGIEAVLARLKQDPTRMDLTIWLGTQYVGQGKTDGTKIPLALYHYARVEAYDGPGAAPAATKAGAKKYFDKQYFGYHGSAEGADKVLAIAKASAIPPEGFDIESITSISKKQLDADEEKRKANPMITFWTDTKTALVSGTAPIDTIKDAELPGTAVPGVTKFKGKIVSLSPALRPKKIVVAVEKDGVGDCTLVFEAALPGKMDVGSEIEFSGVVKDVSKDPYMLTLEVDKANLEGWTGKNAPAAPRAPKKPGN
jgi:hypothetical protein